MGKGIPRRVDLMILDYLRLLMYGNKIARLRED
jgi:hypothetical protein